MTAAELARTRYQNSSKTTASPRAVEFRILSRLTAALALAEEQRQKDYPAYVKALSENLTFWTKLGAAVASDGNTLTRELRAQIFSLSQFTRKHTNRILAARSTADIAPLLEINRNVMEGLRTSANNKSDGASR